MKVYKLTVPRIEPRPMVEASRLMGDLNAALSIVTVSFSLKSSSPFAPPGSALFTHVSGLHLQKLGSQNDPAFLQPQILREQLPLHPHVALSRETRFGGWGSVCIRVNYCTKNFIHERSFELYLRVNMAKIEWSPRKKVLLALRHFSSIYVNDLCQMPAADWLIWDKVALRKKLVNSVTRGRL